MLREMSGEELQMWRAEFALREEERRDRDMDMRGKSKLKKLGR